MKARVFARVVRAYSIEEKVLSIIVLGVVIFMSLQLILDFFHVAGSARMENNGYSEAIVSDRATLLNPLFVDFSQANRDLAALIFSGLTRYDPVTKVFGDDMATLVISPDRTTYRFMLKKDLKWHDGKPVSADDVYFTFHDIIQNPDFQNPVLHVNFDGVKITLIDTQTIEFQLKIPNSFFITNTGVGILPKHLLANIAVNDLPAAAFNLKPVGSGPYKVDSPMDLFDDGKQKVVLNRFDDYYGASPKIRQIRFTIYPNEESLMKERNSFDLLSKVPAMSLDQLKAMKRFNFSDYELPQYTAVFLNQDRPRLKKEKVRLALLKAIDKSELLKLFSDKIAVDTPLLELNQSEWIYKPNLKEARGALYDSGYKFEQGQTEGVRKDAKGNPLQLVLLGHDYGRGSPFYAENKKLTDFLAKAWNRLGVGIDLQLVSMDDFNKRLLDRDYDLVLAGQSLGYNLDTYSYWHSSQAQAQGLNLSNYKSFAADQLIEKIRDIFDPVQKDQKLKDLAKTLANDVPAIFLFRPRYELAGTGKVKGISLDNMAFPSDRFAHIDQWCIDC